MRDNFWLGTAGHGLLWVASFEATNNHFSASSSSATKYHLVMIRLLLFLSLPLYILDEITKIWVDHYFTLNGPRKEVVPDTGSKLFV